ncbi:MAG: TrbC/VirB2 family protein [Gammaproteobacteria bacterium]
MRLNLRNWRKKAVVASTSMLASSASFAASLPFDDTMGELQKAISGKFLTSVAVIMIVITCAMLAFGEWGDGFKKIINIVLWLSVAFGATTMVTSFFGGAS